MDLETWCEFRVENGDRVTGTVGRLLEAERRRGRMIGDGSVMAASPGQGRVHSPRAWGRASAGGDEGRRRRPAPSFRWPREQEQFSVPDKAAETKGKEEAVDACLVRAEGACRTPSPLPAGQYLFPLAGRVCRGRSRCREAEASVLLVQKIARDNTRWIGSEQANIARSGWARKGRRRKIKPGWDGPPKKCQRVKDTLAAAGLLLATPQDALAYCPYRDHALRNALSGT